jgi:hypothetical protein
MKIVVAVAYDDEAYLIEMMKHCGEGERRKRGGQRVHVADSIELTGSQSVSGPTGAPQPGKLSRPKPALSNLRGKVDDVVPAE